jgi:hypothetical protein
MPDTPRIRIRLYSNPWSHRIPDADLVRILTNIAAKRAEHLQAQLEAGNYDPDDDSLGIAIMDPTAPNWQPSSEALLATIAIGPKGDDMVVNAIAKAVFHRDKNRPGGYGVYVDTTQSADGDFAWGFSTKVDDTIGAASGLNQLQDACEAGHALVSFNYFVRTACDEWMKRQEQRPSWFCNQNQAGEMFTDMAAGKVVFDSEVN